MIARKRLLAVVSILIVVAFLNTGMFAALSDVENVNGNEVRAYTPKLWTSTTEDDFYNNTTKINVLTKQSPGNVTLAEKETAESSLYALAGGGTRNFYRYYILGNNWVPRASTPANVGLGGSMAFDESRYIYALRGGTTRDFWRFDTQTNSWSTLNSTPANVGAGGFLRNYETNGKFYALQGGGTGTMWTYDPVTQVWSTLTTSLPPINSGASFIVYMNFIWIIRADPSDTNVFIRLALDGSSWTAMNTAKPFNRDIGIGTSITHGQGAYLLATRGGGFREVFEYSMISNVWIKLGNVPKNSGLKVGSDLAYDNIRPFVTVGGGTNTLLKYNSTLRVWSTMTNAPGPISSGGNLLYVSFASGYSPSGSLNSSVFDTGIPGAKYDSLFANYTLPSGTGIVFKVRASDSRLWIPDLENASNGTWDLSGAWTTVTGNDISFIVGQYVQWEVEMTTTVATSTPVLQEVRIYYRGF